MTTPPPEPDVPELPPNPADHGLPQDVEYGTLMRLFEQLLPGFDPTRVSYIGADYRHVEVRVWDGRAEITLELPIRHVQGSATEGGQTQ